MADALAEWRDECAAVRAAYVRWSRAASDDSALACAAYLAALEREERASNVYADLAHDVRRPTT
jgi:hypothetical protein